MSEREYQVIEAMRRMPGAGRPSVLARVLNLDAPCDWCPVGPPRAGEQCATVPRTSREAVGRVLGRLVRSGAALHLYPGTRMAMYVLPEILAEIGR